MSDFYDAPVSPVEPDAPVCLGTGAGGDLLDEVSRWLARFVIPVDDSHVDLLSIWAAHTYLCVETWTTPRLLIESPVPESGKTTVLEHLERLCFNPIQMSSATPALIVRMLDAGMMTILIDEADRSLSPDKPGIEELLAVLNSGYKRGAVRPILVPDGKGGWVPRKMPTFSPVAMAGNNPNLPDDTISRAIRALMLPDINGQAEDSDWELIEDDCRLLGAQLGDWADIVRNEVRKSRPSVPDGIRGRARERWYPLKRVAVAAGGRWPRLVDDMAIKDLQRMKIEREEGFVSEKPTVAVLRHLCEIWRKGETFIPTETLIERLVWTHPESWGDGSPFGKRLTPQRLGRMLSNGYGIHSGRLDRDGPRGYKRATLISATLRMGLNLPPVETGASGATGETGAEE